MEKVKKKRPKSAPKKPLLLLLTLLFTLACALGLFFLLRTPVFPEPTLPPPTYLLEKTAAEISALAIAPREGVAYPLVRLADGRFSLLGKEDTLLRENVVDSMLSALDSLEANDTLLFAEGEKADPSHFGLAPAQVQITVTYQDGEKKTLRIGSEAPGDEKRYYASVSGDDRIHVLLAPFCEPFFQDLHYLRAFEQPSLNASLLDRIDIAGETSLGLFYTPSGWLMDTPFAYPLSTARTDALLKSIESMAFEACLGSEKEVDLSLYGLASPALTILLTQAPTRITGETTDGEQVSYEIPEKKYSLSLGNETGESGVYLLWEGNVYRASNFLMGFWKELAMESLLLRNPVNLMIQDLDSISFSYNGASSGYHVRMVESITDTNEIAADEYGNILYDAAVRREGEEKDMNAQDFLSWYASLSALGASGKLPEGYQITGEPLAVITLENAFFTRVIEFFPYDALHCAVSVDGKAVFYTETAPLLALAATP